MEAIYLISIKLKQLNKTSYYGSVCYTKPPPFISNDKCVICLKTESFHFFENVVFVKNVTMINSENMFGVECY